MAEASSKDMLVMLPLLGSALAVTFDVGYSYGIDINTFTLFSITEHVTFALEALPFAIGASLMVLFAPLSLDFVRARSLRVNKSAAASEPAPFYSRKFFWVALAVFVLNLVTIWLDQALLSYVATIFSLIFLGCTIWLQPEDLRALTITFVASSFGLSSAFAYGFDKGSDYRKSKVYKYTVKTNPSIIKARVVRSGERGLLFFEEASKDLVFLPWSEIRGLTSGVDVSKSQNDGSVRSPSKQD